MKLYIKIGEPVTVQLVLVKGPKSTIRSSRQVQLPQLQLIVAVNQITTLTVKVATTLLAHLGKLFQLID